MTKKRAIEELRICECYSVEPSVEALDMAIESLEQQSIAEERYQDLIEYFGDKDIAKCVLEDREEFKKWLERIKWHVRKANELARKLEQQPSDGCEYNRGYRDGYDKGNLNGYELRKAEEKKSEDCVSIAELEKWLDLNFSFGGACRKLELFERLEKELPRVTPTFPKGATNGDVIMAMFPNAIWTNHIHSGIHCAIEGFSSLDCDEDWWNALYKRGNEE